MKAPRRRARARSREPEFSFEKLEDRRLLAGDFVHAVTDPLPVQDRISTLRSHLDFDQNESVQLIELTRDQIGFAHFKYQLKHNGVPVQNSVYSVHVKDRQIVSLSGNYAPVTETASRPQFAVSEEVAFQAALEFAGAKQYIWEDPIASAMEGLAAERPQGELVYFTPRDGESTLAYKFDVYSIEPFDRDYVFVDATRGREVLGTYERIHGGDEPATGTTLFDGTVDITVDKYNPGSGVFEYRLREGVDQLPGQRPIQTLDVQGGISLGSAVDYTSITTDFSGEDVRNGVQLHYGAENTYDYFLLEHGRDSYDDNGAKLRSYGSFRNNWVNAVWTGSSTRFGDGDGVNYGPLTALDVVGHEYGHGVVEFSADLIYSFQSGALNESFADIFGNAIERYARGSTDWLLGADFALAGNPFRSMADPKLYGDPDTFMGDNWHPSSDTSDNGGVHTNSGVQNKWFYILSEGEAGTNDLGWTYDVAGIGFDAAAAIAYRNLTVYLNPDSNYAEAREGAIQAAIDLYGPNSPEHMATDAAWIAVGLDEPVITVGALEGLFQPVRSLGSQVYHATTSGSVEAPAGDITNEGARDVYSLSLDANQTVSAVVRGLEGFEPIVRINGPIGEFSVDGTSYGEFGVTNAVEAQKAGLYTIIVKGADSGATGDYVLDVYLNADIETESFGGLTNNDRFTAQVIDFATVGLGRPSIANSIAVVGSVAFNESNSSGGGGGGTTLIGDDFETGAWPLPQPPWSTASTSNGRIRVTGDYGTGGGNFALIMDSDTNQVYALNEAIWTVDLSTAATPFLNFGFMEWFDETDSLPPVFAGSVQGDGVSISDDGVTWFTIQDATQSTAGEWIFVSYNLLDFADATGLDVTGEIQVKFQQYDNQPIDVADGRGFDEISISETPIGGGGGQGPGDWFAFEIKEFETVSLAIAGINAYGSDLLVELYGPDGELLVSQTSVAATNVEGYISQFFNPDPDDIFYARVTGDIADYNLVVTRGAEYNVEVIGEPATDITLVEGALGHVSSGDTFVIEPDDFPDNTVLDNAIDGLQLSNEVTGGSVYAEDVTGIMVPATGHLTFTPNLAGLHGWREGSNELRVDFVDPQMFVSIDVVSNDSTPNTTDKAFLRAYASDGTLLQEVISADVHLFELDTIAVSRPVSEIAYIIAAGLGNDATPLDNLVYKADVDVDVYTIDAVIGERIRFGGFLPGEGAYEFVNGLDLVTGSALRMELVDPLGTVVDVGNEFVQTVAAFDGTYELRVSAESGSGEYYLDRNLGLPFNGVDFGPVGSSVWQDYTLVNDDVYDVRIGYGWTDTTGFSLREVRRGNALTEDYARMRSGTFVVDVQDGVYDVDVFLGFVRRADSTRFTIEGIVDVFVPGFGLNVTRSYVATVDDGQLTMEFSGEGGLNQFINVVGLSIAEKDSGGRSAPPSNNELDIPLQSFTDNWNIEQAVPVSKKEGVGVRESLSNVVSDPGERTLPGSGKLSDLNEQRDRGFAKIFAAKKTLEIEELGEVEIESLIQAKYLDRAS